MQSMKRVTLKATVCFFGQLLDVERIHEAVHGEQNVGLLIGRINTL